MLILAVLCFIVKFFKKASFTNERLIFYKMNIYYPRIEEIIKRFYINFIEKI